MKNLQNLGKTLSKKEQKAINGGACTNAAQLSCEADGHIWASYHIPFLPCLGYCLCRGGDLGVP